MRKTGRNTGSMALRFFAVIILAFITHNATAQQRDIRLYAKMDGKTLLSSGDSTWIWAYGYYAGNQLTPITLPGPLLTVYLGDTVNVHFRNLSGEMHTIHLHGTDVNYRNDGSAHTWPPVNPNDSTTYTWEVTYPGSYFYHCHVMTVLHLQMGMYGMIIAKNYPDTTKLWTGGPGFNRSYSYLISDMDTTWNNHPLSPGLLNAFSPNYFMINGYSDWMMFARPNQVIDALVGDSVCIHIGNLGYCSARVTFPAGSNPTIYQSDARILPVPITSDTLRIYPGERYEIIFRPTTFITSWIQVDYLDAILDDSLATNYIGFNQFVHPTGVLESATTMDGGSIYPNPAVSEFHVSSLGNEQLYIVGSDGKMCVTQGLEQGDNTIDCSNLSSGIYFVIAGEFRYRLVIVRD